MSPLRLLARPLLAAPFVATGLDHLRHPGPVQLPDSNYGWDDTDGSNRYWNHDAWHHDDNYHRHNWARWDDYQRPWRRQFRILTESSDSLIAQLMDEVIDNDSMVSHSAGLVCRPVR